MSGTTDSSSQSEQQELPLEPEPLWPMTFERYQQLHDPTEWYPPKHWTPWQKHQWYRWRAIYELLEDLHELDKDVPIE